MQNLLTRSVDPSRRAIIVGGGALGAASIAGAPRAAEAPTGPAASQYASAFPVVATASGKVRGLDYEGVKSFRGIPYGAPTSGANRFRPPRPTPAWTGVKDAFGYGPQAPQETLSPRREYIELLAFDQQPGGMSEDCLVLNVWTPALTGRRPVLVCLHGGGFVTGSSGNAGYYGDPLARFGDVVVVSINHRLGALGFLDLSALDDRGEFEGSGVAGMLDIVASLRWVRENIAAFGGDPGQVMVFGQSGGGQKTTAVLAMPSAEGLVHRAAVQSGSLLRFTTRDQAARTASDLLGQLGLPRSRLADLRRVPFHHILAAQMALGRAFGPAPNWAPVVGGPALPAHPFEPGSPRWAAGIPMIIGTTLDDYALNLVNFDLDDIGLKGVADARFGAAATTAIAAYRRAYPEASPYLLQARMLTDFEQRARANAQADRKAALGGAPLWLYRFDSPSPSLGGKFGAVHAMDVGLVMHNTLASLPSGASDEFRRLADQMATAWVAFARTGDPNNALLPPWPAFDPTRRATMIFDRTCRVVDDPDGDLRRLVAESAVGR